MLPGTSGTVIDDTGIWPKTIPWRPPCGLPGTLPTKINLIGLICDFFLWVTELDRQNMQFLNEMCEFWQNLWFFFWKKRLKTKEKLTKMDKKLNDEKAI